MIETKSVDLERPVNWAGEVVHFTGVNDFHWAGVIDLPPLEQISFSPNLRSDIYILQGELIDHLGTSYVNGSFLSPGENRIFNSGPGGTRLFVYRGQDAPSRNSTALRPDQLDWYTGGAPGLKVASLYHAAHALMLVSWIRGTQMRFHHHSRGEEIFVLKGELRDERGHYPSGTWQRLPPGTGHAPYTETDTLILLRNGHL